MEAHVNTLGAPGAPDNSSVCKWCCHMAESRIPPHVVAHTYPHFYPEPRSVSEPSRSVPVTTPDRGPLSATRPTSILLPQTAHHAASPPAKPSSGAPPAWRDLAETPLCLSLGPCLWSSPRPWELLQEEGPWPCTGTVCPRVSSSQQARKVDSERSDEEIV